MMQGADEYTEYEEASSRSAALTPQFAQAQVQANPTQLEILEAYLETYVLPNFHGFISAAPLAPDLRALHRFILASTLNTPSVIFQALLNQFYPCIADSSHTSYQQNTHLRNYLIAFNQLCNGEANVNGGLFEALFDKRLSPKKDSPTKKSLIAGYLKKQLPLIFNLTVSIDDKYVALAHQQRNELLLPKQNSTSSARKKLEF